MKYLIYILVCICIYSCVKEGKDTEDTLKGDKTLNGRLSYIDLYNGIAKEEVVANRKVFIAYKPSDTLNYLYYSKTDAQGNFSFKRLDKNTEYDLFFYDSINNIKYSAFKTIAITQDTVRLVATNDTVRQNGIFVTVIDESGEAVNNAQVKLFNNKNAFDNDSDTASSGFIKSGHTDAYGRILFYNHLEGTYHLRSKISYSSLALSTDTTLSFPGSGIHHYVLQLKKQESMLGSIEVTVNDVGKTPVYGTDVYLYNGQYAFYQDSIFGYIRHTKADVTGKAMFKDLNPGFYFIKAQAAFGTYKLNGMDSVMVHEKEKIALPVDMK